MDIDYINDFIKDSDFVFMDSSKKFEGKVIFIKYRKKKRIKKEIKDNINNNQNILILETFLNFYGYSLNTIFMNSKVVLMEVATIKKSNIIGGMKIKYNLDNSNNTKIKFKLSDEFSDLD